MNNDERIQAHIDVDLKAAAEEVSTQLGISTGEAIRLYELRVALQRGTPFDIDNLPSKVPKSFEDRTHQFIEEHEQTLKGLLNR